MDLLVTGGAGFIGSAFVRQALAKNLIKAETELGYAPREPFAAGLRDTISWYAANRSWWEPLKAFSAGRPRSPA